MLVFGTPLDPSSSYVLTFYQVIQYDIRYEEHCYLLDYNPMTHSLPMHMHYLNTIFYALFFSFVHFILHFLFYFSPNSLSIRFLSF